MSTERAPISCWPKNDRRCSRDVKAVTTKNRRGSHEALGDGFPNFIITLIQREAILRRPQAAFLVLWFLLLDRLAQALLEESRLAA